MGNKLDPRTGIIMSGPSRPSKFPPSSNKQHPKKSGNMFPAKPFPTGQSYEPQYIQATQLYEFAKQIGLVIAAQLKSIPVEAKITLSQLGTVMPNQTQQPKAFAINIDESIIDVGIGDQDPLEKGKDSAQLAKETKASDNLADAKRSLRALKKGK